MCVLKMTFITLLQMDRVDRQRDWQQYLMGGGDIIRTIRSTIWSYSIQHRRSCRHPHIQWKTNCQKTALYQGGQIKTAHFSHVKTFSCSKYNETVFTEMFRKFRRWWLKMQTNRPGGQRCGTPSCWADWRLIQLLSGMQRCVWINGMSFMTQ